jgi:hypothetical protein
MIIRALRYFERLTTEYSECPLLRNLGLSLCVLCELCDFVVDSNNPYLITNAYEITPQSHKVTKLTKDAQRMTTIIKFGKVDALLGRPISPLPIQSDEEPLLVP